MKTSWPEYFDSWDLEQMCIGVGLSPAEAAKMAAQARTTARHVLTARLLAMRPLPPAIAARLVAAVAVRRLRKQKEQKEHL